MAFLNNPQSGAKEQRNLLIAVVVIFGAFLVWEAFMAPTPSQQNGQEQQAAASAEDTEDDEPQDTSAGDGDEDVAADGGTNAQAEAPRRLATEELEVYFTNVGGRAAGASILSPEQYIPREDELEIFPQLDECEDGGIDCAQNRTALSRRKLPLSLRLKGFNELNEQSVYEYLNDETSCSEGTCDALAMRWVSRDGSITVERRYEVSEQGPYAIQGSIVVRNDGSNERAFDALELVNYSEWSPKSGGIFNQTANVVEGICHTDGDAKSKPGQKLDEVRYFDEAIAYAGFNERYFLSSVGLVEGDGAEPVNADYCELKQDEDDPNDQVVAILGTEGFSLSEGEAREFQFTWYLGPKRFEYLNEHPQELGDSVKYGIFSFLSVPIRHILIFLHGLVGNWGLAIIFLTICIKVALLPITTRAYKSMEAMKRVQPKLEKLKEKYENDQQKMAEAQMKLFREEGVNPLGGCLPLLLQMPVYFALYRTIWGSAELYNAPFFGWIQDLSQPDPYYVLPIILGVMMFGQQKLMPSSGSNPQMKMMQYIMPLMFIPIMLFLPSGLVLYIFVNMILTILQQLFIKQRYVSPEKA